MFREDKDGDFIYGNLSNGKWIIKDKTKLIEIKSPIDKRTLGFVEAMDKENVDEAIKIAKIAQRKWREVPTNQKARLLHNVADLLEERIEEIADVMVLEIAKDRKSCMSEVKRTADLIRFTADTAENMRGESIPGDSFPGFKNDKISIVTREPVGVVLAISPFNEPVNLAASKIAPALMAGNTVIIKHDSHVPGCAQALEQAFADAGVPKGVLQTVIADHDATEKMIRDPRISAISFTGSTAGGSKVAAIAASEIKPAVLELGGSDPAIVLADADIDKAVDVLTTSRFICAGQSCIAAKRILVEETIYAEFVEKLCTRLAGLKVGDPTQANTDIGPIARAQLRDVLHDQVTRSISAGANCIMGGKIPEGAGSFYPVTLLTDVPLHAAAFTEETFGPVAAVRAVKDVDEAFAIANDTAYGLGASIWTESERGAQLAARFEAGQVAINGIVKSDPRLPSGGIKRSGYGKELGPHGIREFVNAQQVWQGE